jgi:outer membrane protein insertion porin family
MARIRDLFLGLFLLATPITLSAEPFCYENQIIEQVEVEMVESTCTPDVQEAIINRLKMHVGKPFSQSDFDLDLKLLASEYARVEPSLSGEDGKLHIALKIWQKPLIKSIAWQGNKHFKTQVLKDELGVKTSTIFDKISFHRAINKVRAYYVKKGYYQAKVDYSMSHAPGSSEVDILITIEEGQAGTIREIVFENFTKSEQEEIEELMYTKEYKILTSWLTDEGTYREELVQQDKYVVLNYLQNLGYADAQVEFHVTQPADSNRITIRIVADRGELYTIEKISISGNTLYSEETLREYFAFSEGGPYSPEAIRKTQERIHNLYGKVGYIDAYLGYEAKLEPCGPGYSIHLTMEEGEQYRVGMIKVFGNSATQTKMILHETLLVPGEVFNLAKMHYTQERLENIGFFSSVNVYYAESSAFGEDGNKYRDVHIDVEETSTAKLGASIGYSTADKLFGGINFTENNFNYEGLSRLFSEGYSALRGGGEYLSFNGNIGQRSQKYFLSWTKPYFNDTPWAVGFDVERSTNRYTSSDYTIDAWGFSVHATRLINQLWKVVNHYRIRDSHVKVNKRSNEELMRESHFDGIVSALGSAFIYDDTDHPRRPTRGFKSSISGEIAGIGGDYRFASLAYMNNYYVKVNERDVIRLRGDLRYIFPFGGTTVRTMPLDERIFMGGENNIRGYRPYRIGPLFEHSKDPSGGTSMQLASIEYVRRYSDTFGAFLFLDAGALSDKWDRIGRIYSATGLGARWCILGDAPLTFGLGFPLNAKHRNQIKRFFINIEGTF